MTITVGLLGATGRAGGWVLEACLEKEYKIVALARNPAKLKDYEEKITIVKGDACEEEGIKALLTKEKIDVIISTLGSPSKEVLICKKAADALTSALKNESTIPRVVWMTSTGINEATDQAKWYTMFGTATSSPWFAGFGFFGLLQFKILIPFLIGQDLWDDMGHSETVIRETEKVNAKTVIVRPTNMWPVSEHPTFSDKWREEGGENLEYVLIKADDPPPGKWIWRKAIAAALIDLVEDTSKDGSALSLFQKE